MISAAESSLTPHHPGFSGSDSIQVDQVAGWGPVMTLSWFCPGPIKALLGGWLARGWYPRARVRSRERVVQWCSGCSGAAREPTNHSSSVKVQQVQQALLASFMDTPQTVFAAKALNYERLARHASLCPLSIHAPLIGSSTPYSNSTTRASGEAGPSPEQEALSRSVARHASSPSCSICGRIL